MNKFSIIILLILNICWAQNGYFESIENLSTINNPSEAASKMFLWRTKNNGNYQFVKVEMNNLLYQSKQVFRWPANLNINDLPSIQLSNDDIEIIFNDKVIMADTSAISLVIGDSTINLKSIPTPNLILITSKQEIEVKPLSNLNKSSQKTPLFLDASSKAQQAYLFRGKDLIPKILEFNNQGQSYRNLEVNLIPIPRKTLQSHILNLDSIKSLENDSLRLIKLNELQISTQNWLIQDSLEISLYLDSLNKQIPQTLDSIYPQQMFIIRKDFISNALQINDFEKTISDTKEKINLLESYKIEILKSKTMKDRWKYIAPKTLLIQRQFNDKVSLNISIALGRNLPKEATDFGAKNLAGFVSGFSWQKLFLNNLLFEPQIYYSYHQWQFNHLQKQLSHQNNLGLTTFINFPVLVAPQLDSLGNLTGGTAIFTALGPTIQGRHTQIYDLKQKHSDFGYTYGLHAQLRVAFTQIPVVFLTSYSYALDQYGELSIGITIPLIDLSNHGDKP